MAKESASSLRSLTDNLQNHSGALQNLKLPTDSWDILLIHIIISKSDHVTSKEWEISLDNEKPTYKQLIDFLSKKCITLETIAENNKKHINFDHKLAKNQSQRSHSQMQTSRYKAHDYALTVTGQRENASTCPFCNKVNHFIYNCADFIKLTLQEKYDEVKRLRLCGNCLRPGHFKWNCRSGKCKKCHLNHNTILHNANNQSNIGTDRVETPPTQTVASSQYWSNHPVSQNDNNQMVFLSTAQILISDIQGRTHVCNSPGGIGA